MNSKKLELIQQLLAKAESTTPEEAEALTEAATKLMAKHGIDAAMIAASKKGPSEEIVTRELFMTGIYSNAMIEVVNQTVNAFGTMRVLFSTNAHNVNDDGKWVKGVRAYVTGFESDVEQTMILLESLQLQSMAAMSSWWRVFPGKGLLTKMEQFKARRDFFTGFGYGVGAKIAEAVVAAKTESDQEHSGQSTALVLRDRKAAVDDHVAQNFGRLRKLNGFQSSGTGAINDGVTAGRNANIGQKGVGSRKVIAR